MAVTVPMFLWSIVHCSEDRHKLFILCWKLPCSTNSIKRPPLNECQVSGRFLEEMQQLKIYIYDIGDQYVNTEAFVIYIQRFYR